MVAVPCRSETLINIIEANPASLINQQGTALLQENKQTPFPFLTPIGI